MKCSECQSTLKWQPCDWCNGDGARMVDIEGRRAYQQCNHCGGEKGYWCCPQCNGELLV
jgi:hypothetical protein